MEDVRKLATRIAHEEGVNPILVRRMIEVESGWTARAISGAGAMGYMQVMPKTFAAWRDPRDPRDIFDPTANIRAGTRYLKHLLDRYAKEPETAKLAIAAYNAGPTRVDRLLAVPNITETQQHVRKVLTNEIARDPFSTAGDPPDVVRVGQDPATSAHGDLKATLRRPSKFTPPNEPRLLTPEEKAAIAQNIMDNPVLPEQNKQSLIEQTIARHEGRSLEPTPLEKMRETVFNFADRVTLVPGVHSGAGAIGRGMQEAAEGALGFDPAAAIGRGIGLPESFTGPPGSGTPPQAPQAMADAQALQQGREADITAMQNNPFMNPEVSLPFASVADAEGNVTTPGMGGFETDAARAGIAEPSTGTEEAGFIEADQPPKPEPPGPSALDQTILDLQNRLAAPQPELGFAPPTSRFGAFASGVISALDPKGFNTVVQPQLDAAREQNQAHVTQQLAKRNQDLQSLASLADLQAQQEIAARAQALKEMEFEVAQEEADGIRKANVSLFTQAVALPAEAQGAINALMETGRPEHLELANRLRVQQEAISTAMDHLLDGSIPASKTLADSMRLQIAALRGSIDTGFRAAGVMQRPQRMSSQAREKIAWLNQLKTDAQSALTMLAQRGDIGGPAAGSALGEMVQAGASVFGNTGFSDLKDLDALLSRITSTVNSAMGGGKQLTIHEIKFFKGLFIRVKDTFTKKRNSLRSLVEFADIFTKNVYAAQGGSPAGIGLGTGFGLPEGIPQGSTHVATDPNTGLAVYRSDDGRLLQAIAE